MVAHPLDPHAIAALQIRLRRDDFEDEHELAKFAAPRACRWRVRDSSELIEDERPRSTSGTTAPRHDAESAQPH